MRLLLSVAVSLLLAASARPSPAAPPDPPAFIPLDITFGSVTGSITDSDGAAIPSASITFNHVTQDPKDDPPVTAVATPTGRFTFPLVPTGPFTLSVAAKGFAPKQTSAELHPGETLEIPAIALRAGITTTVQVDADQTKIAEAQVKQEEKQRVLGIIPNFYVVYEPNPVPLNAKQKSDLALKTLIDPANLILNGIVAGADQATDTYAWEQGASGYAKRYAANYGTLLTGALLTNAALPILLKQDPRYYYKGTGSVASRIGYAFANAVVCKGDNHHWQPNYSGILGGLGANALSNVYYPAANRAATTTMFEGAAIGLGFTGVSNLIQEFAMRKLTSHVPHRTRPAPLLTTDH
jgi:hypothetical protein